MENYYSPFIFGAIWILAYCGAKFINYLSMRFDGFELKECFKRRQNYRLLQKDMYNLKYKKLHDMAFYYYLRLCVNNAVDLSYDLASKDMKRIAKTKCVNQLYDKFFREKTTV